MTLADLPTGAFTGADLRARINAAVQRLRSFPFELEVAISDETTNISTGLNKVRFVWPVNVTLTEVILFGSEAPTGGPITVNVKDGASTIFSTKPQIAVGQKTSAGGAVPGVLSDTALLKGAEIAIDIDLVGSANPGKGLKVLFVGTRT